jgi:4Fe-4S ferredoxin
MLYAYLFIKYTLMSDENTGSPADINIDVMVEMDIHDSHFIYTQTAYNIQKTLDYDYKRCNGCGICINLCPAGAIEAGPLIEIATGLDAPPVIIDQTKCSFCGMCASFCPVRAMKMDIDGEDILTKPEYPELDSKVIIDDKCLPCMLCEKACPNEALKLEFTFPDKEKIAPFKKGQSGEIELDMDKCNFCGICAYFCQAFILLEKEPAPDNPVPFQDLLIDLDKCDYCKICEELCPEDAITVKGKLEIPVPEITGTLIIDNNKCTRCGWCKKVCPYDAVQIEKPFTGEIVLKESRLTDCDPIGCHGCFNVCPSHAWYIPADKKIAVVEDFCIYCGACEKACHVFAIDVERLDVKHTQGMGMPWSAQWNDAINAIKTGLRYRPDTNRKIEIDGVQILHSDAKEIASRQTNENMIEIRSRIDKLLPLLGNIKFRYEWEKGNIRSVEALIRKNSKVIQG